MLTAAPFRRRPAAAPLYPTFATFRRDLLGFLPGRVMHFITAGPGGGGSWESGRPGAGEEPGQLIVAVLDFFSCEFLVVGS